ncbi:hypothetical protein EYF80_039904 [Liparis tanakae]|uniref:Uncharacterized protein n=1 Tax=Liparis tanakae TaxID=230148 RepID=A0A4Z2GAZ0_9TELE|nr:hypothetical protein EYF80_039904 [Liparis tanakae]
MLPLIIKGTEVERADSYTFLGQQVTSDLSWTLNTTATVITKRGELICSSGAPLQRQRRSVSGEDKKLFWAGSDHIPSCEGETPPMAVAEAQIAILKVIVAAQAVILSTMRNTTPIRASTIPRNTYETASRSSFTQAMSSSRSFSTGTPLFASGSLHRRRPASGHWDEFFNQ